MTKNNFGTNHHWNIVFDISQYIFTWCLHPSRISYNLQGSDTISTNYSRLKVVEYHSLCLTIASHTQVMSNILTYSQGIKRPWHNCTPEKKRFSGPICHALSHDMIRAVASAIFKNHWITSRSPVDLHGNANEKL